MADAAEDFGFVPDAQPIASPNDLGFIPDAPPTPNMNPAKNALMGGYKASKVNEQGKPVTEASSFLDDWMAGWQQSTTALGITNRQLPTTVLPEDAGRLARIVSQAGTLAGDLPAMLAGGVAGRYVGTAAGAAAGSVAGPAGTAAGGVVGGKIGQNAGAFALPAAIRQVLMDHYKKGDIQDFSDFYDRSSAAFLSALKAGAVGAATGAAGVAAGAALPAAVAPLLKLGAVTGAEGAAMVTVGKAMDGKVPNASDFADAAVLLGGLHLVGAGVNLVAGPIAGATNDRIQEKLMNTYSKTGIQPHEIYQMAANDPVLRQEVLSADNTVPSGLKAAVDPAADADPHTINFSSEKDFVNPNLSKATIAEGAGGLHIEPLPGDGEPPEPPDLSDAEKKVLSKITSGPTDQPEQPGMSFAEVYYSMVDRFDPLKRATEILRGDKDLGAKEDPYVLARSVLSGRRADLMIEQGPREFDDPAVKTGTRGLSQILGDADDLERYKAYQVSKHALDLESQGVKTGVDLDAAKKVVASGKAAFEGLAKENVNFRNDMIDYLSDSGVVSKDAVQKMKDMWQNYVPFKRDMTGEEPTTQGGGGKNTNVYNPIKNIEGSERNIINPIKSDIRNAHAITAVAEKNRVNLSLTNLIDEANKNGDFSLGKKIKVPMNAIRIGDDEMGRYLESQGLDSDNADALTVFRPDKQPLADNQIVSFKDGKRQVYEVDPQLAESLKGLDPVDTSNVMKVAQSVAQLTRNSRLASPAFATRHFLRQEATAALFAKQQYVPFYDTLRGLGVMMQDHFGLTDEFSNYVARGGANDSITYVDDKYIKTKIDDLNEQTGFLDKGWNTLKSGAQFFKTGTALLDEARTFQKYRNAVNAGEDPWQAVYDARDSGIDIARTGAKIRAFTALVPFTNARIQGLDVIGRQFKANPGLVSARMTAGIVLPSMYLWYANHDKDWYKNLPDLDRDQNWHIEIGDADKGDGYVVRIPKPFEPGIVFGAGTERTMDAFFTDNPHAYKGFSKAISESVVPQYIPAFAAPMIEQYSNKSFYDGSPLVPHSMEQVEPAYQYKPYTSTTAKIIAGALRQIPAGMTQNPGSLGSPAIIDNYIKSWTGGIGDYFVALADKAAESSGAASAAGINYNANPPEKTLADMPFLKSFVIRNPTANTKALNDFYDRFEQTQTRLNTIHMLAKEGDYDDMQKEYAAAQANDQMVNLSGYKRTIGQQLHLIQTIYKDPDSDPHEKRQQIDELYMSITKEATLANQILDGIDKQVGK